MTAPNKVWLIGLVLCLSAAMAWAQLYSGSVVGVISDPSKAVIPGAKVSLVDDEKGFTFNVDADSSGRYLFRNVAPGKYSITVTADGFQAEKRTGIQIDVNQNVTVDFAMQLTTGKQEITINTDAPLLSTQDSTTGQVLNRKYINDLPNVGRDVMTLAYLTPGIVSSQDGGQTGGQGNNFISNGSRNSTADVLTDGITVTDFDQNSGQQNMIYQPALDSVEELKVQTSNFSAEFGFSGATVVNMITRSGTNQFHGSLHEAFRNQILDAQNFFDNSAGNPLPGLRRNQFGGTVGGPIKRNKTFFFFDYDGVREINQSTASGGMPSAAERQGNFGELCGYNGGTFDSAGMCSAAAGQLWDPYSGTYNANVGGAVRSAYIPFNNMATYISPGSPALAGTAFQPAPVAGNLIDPVAAKMINYFPMPNLGVGTPNYQYFYNWIGSGSNVSRNNQFDIKIDHRFSDKSLLTAKYSQQSSNFHAWNSYGNIADPNTSGPAPGTAHAFALTENYTFSPTLLLSVSYGFVRNWGLQAGISGDYKNINAVKQQLGLPAYMDIASPPALPYININDSYGTNLGTQPYSYYLNGDQVHQLQGTLSWIKGSHELKFGVEGRLHLGNYANPGPTGGQFGFDYTGTSQDPVSGDGGDAMASFLTGFSTGNNGTYEVANWVSTENYQTGAFVQDNWKVRRNLTLNIGMRYDVTLPRTERYNRMNSFDPNVVSPLQVPGLGTLYGGEIFASPSDRTVYNVDPTNFQPRFGISWQPLDKTVIRGGYGIFYSTSKVGAAGPGAWGYEGYVRDTPWITSYNNDGATPFGRLSDPFPGTGPQQPPGNSQGLLNDVGYMAWGPVKSLSQTPQEQTWSLGFQRELPWGILAEGDYVGKKGTHLYLGGAGNLDILGPQIEKYSASQVAALLTYVPNPFYGIVKDPNTFLSAPTVQAFQLQLPFPQFGGVGGDAPPVANSSYNAAQFRLEKRFAHGLQFLVNYTFSKAIDDASATDGNIDFKGIGKSHLQDPNNYALERSVSAYNATHVLNISHVYELPFGKGKAIGSNWNPVVNAILGGWQLNGIWTFQTGFPLTVGLQGGFTLPTYGGQAPDILARPVRNTGSDWLTNYFANPQVFVAPPPFTVGNAPRTLPYINRPGQENAELSIFKSFPLPFREGMRVEFRLEALNAFNHPQFGAPNTSVNSGIFGQVTNQVNQPRQVQLTGKFYF